MPITLSTEQEKALLQLDLDADLAVETRELSTQADVDVINAQANADHLKQSSVETMAKALDSAQAFINLMLPGRIPAGAGLGAKGTKK